MIHYFLNQDIASSILSSPQNTSSPTINDGLPKILLFRAASVFDKNSFSISLEFALEIILSFLTLLYWEFIEYDLGILISILIYFYLITSLIMTSFFSTNLKVKSIN